MYRTCISCAADLGSNEAVEEFPVGARLAFDAARGRLWAVCGRCRRWNLAPIEERWEAVESAERLFRDARLRVHSENIGLARLPDGTRLVRVGEALPGELAAWRYGDQLVRRRWRIRLGAGGTVAGGVALAVGGTPLFAAAGAPAILAGFGVQAVANWMILREAYRPVLRLPPDESPSGRELVVRRSQAYLARVVPARSGEGVAVQLPSPLPLRREEAGGVVRWIPSPPLHLEGETAHRFLDRTLVGANAWGLGAARVDRALRALDAAGGPGGLLRTIGREEAGIYPAWLAVNTNAGPPDPKGAWRRLVGTFRGERIAGAELPGPKRSLPRETALALEMALHEERERRALQGELAALEAAWREAEEIAAIADTLPDDPLDRLRGA